MSNVTLTLELDSVTGPGPVLTVMKLDWIETINLLTQLASN